MVWLPRFFVLLFEWFVCWTFVKPGNQSLVLITTGAISGVKLAHFMQAILFYDFLGSNVTIILTLFNEMLLHYKGRLLGLFIQRLFKILWINCTYKLPSLLFIWQMINVESPFKSILTFAASSSTFFLEKKDITIVLLQ